MQCNLNTLKFKNNRSKCSNYINNARASLEFIIREILVEFLACHLITWVTLIRKQFSSQNDENLKLKNDLQNGQCLLWDLTHSNQKHNFKTLLFELSEQKMNVEWTDNYVRSIFVIHYIVSQVFFCFALMAPEKKNNKWKIDGRHQYWNITRSPTRLVDLALSSSKNSASGIAREIQIGSDLIVISIFYLHYIGMSCLTLWVAFSIQTHCRY